MLHHVPEECSTVIMWGILWPQGKRLDSQYLSDKCAHSSAYRSVIFTCYRDKRQGMWEYQAPYWFPACQGIGHLHQLSFSWSPCYWMW